MNPRNRIKRLEDELAALKAELKKPEEFHIGQRVRHEKYGEGTVMGFADGFFPIGVCFDKERPNYFHDLWQLGEGKTVRKGYGYWCNAEGLEALN